MVAMVAPLKKTQKNYEKFIFDLKANFYAKFEENLKTWTYHLFFILHESYVNLYLNTLQSIDMYITIVYNINIKY